MSDYIIFTDSSADLPNQLVEQWGLGVAPLSVYLDNHHYVNYPDWREISAHDFYEKLRTGKMSKSSATNAETFKEVMRPYLRAGKDILNVAFSSALSATCSAAQLAAKELLAEFPERKIIVVDSLLGSSSQGLLVSFAVDKLNQGATIEENAKYVEELKTKINIWVSVDDLMFLFRGGRLSRASAVVGGALGMKPILHVNDEGKLEKTAVTRGQKGALKKLFELMKEKIADTRRIYISHSDCINEALQLRDMIFTETGCNDIVVDMMGPVIGSHAGPGTIALSFVGNKR
jgi:DegV family protein with EDD domain